MSDVYCQYCGGQSEFVTGKEIYPHRKDLYDLKFYRCTMCDARVGCHKPNKKLGLKGDEPLGVLANAELRRAKSMAHAAFDSLWKNKSTMKERKDARKKAYSELAQHLGIERDDCHIGMFSIAQCRETVHFANKVSCPCCNLTDREFERVYPEIEDSEMCKKCLKKVVV